MKLERIIQGLTCLLAVSGLILWTTQHRSMALWFWLGALAVLSVPLILWLILSALRRGRD
jgi:hypothetical protein